MNELSVFIDLTLFVSKVDCQNIVKRNYWPESLLREGYSIKTE